MSALHEAARRVVSAWVSTRPAWIEQCNAAVLALDAALKAQAGCDTETDCTSQPWCRISGECHRKQAQPEPAQEADPTDPGHDIDVLREHVRHLERRVRELHAQQAEPAQKPVAWRSAEQYSPDVGSWFEYYDEFRSVSPTDGLTPLYTTPPQRPPLTDEEIDAMWRDPQQGDWDHRKFARAIERKVRGEV